jgi:hypothetical protein
VLAGASAGRLRARFAAADQPHSRGVGAWPSWKARDPQSGFCRFPRCRRRRAGRDPSTSWPSTSNRLGIASCSPRAARPVEAARLTLELLVGSERLARAD